jgi:hypothetical protein
MRINLPSGIFCGQGSLVLGLIESLVLGLIESLALG